MPGYIVINPVNAPGDTLGDAWVSIETEAVEGRTAAQVAEAQISSAGAGFNITRQDLELGGEEAVMVDGLPGPDPWRKMFVVHDNRLYTLTFQPWQPVPEGNGQRNLLEDLYTLVVDSFHFLAVGGGNRDLRRILFWLRYRPC